MSVVYFVRSGATGPIKIGVALDADTRLRALQSGNPEPLTLLGTVPGSFDEERKLHHAFWFARGSGEWFKPSLVILEAAALAAIGTPLEEILAFAEDVQWRHETKRSLLNLGDVVSRARRRLRNPEATDKEKRHAHRTVALCHTKMRNARPYLRRAGQHIDRMRERLALRSVA